MESLLSSETPGRFRAPKASLGDLDAEVAAELIAAAAEIALIVSPDGIIRDVAFGAEGLAEEGFDAWIGQAWADTVTAESRPKIEELLNGARARADPRWRQVNHASRRGPDIPIRYRAMLAGTQQTVVAIGRDLRVMAALQQRLIEAQLGMEREYSRLRSAETRYRLLFHVTSEAVLILDADTLKVVEANPAAAGLLGKSFGRTVGRRVLELFDPGSAQALQALVAAARAAGRAEDMEVRLTGSSAPVVLAASSFRQENAAFVLLRMRRRAGSQAGGAESRLLKLVGSLPDGFVVTTPDRRIVSANQAFLNLAQVSREEQAIGEPLDRWLGRSALDFNVLIASLKEHGSVRNFPTILRSEHGSRDDIEITAVAVLHGEDPCFGFVLRTPGRRPPADPRATRELPRSVEQLKELIGRVPLKDLVRETTEVIERLCIEAALELTGDNRASAAQMLGLSRQSLYVKLRRYGLSDPEDGEFALQ